MNKLSKQASITTNQHQLNQKKKLLFGSLKHNLITSYLVVWKNLMFISELKDVPGVSLLQESDSSTVTTTQNLIIGSPSNPKTEHCLLYLKFEITLAVK